MRITRGRRHRVIRKLHGSGQVHLPDPVILENVTRPCRMFATLTPSIQTPLEVRRSSEVLICPEISRSSAVWQRIPITFV